MAVTHAAVIRIPRVTDNDFARDTNLATAEYVVLMHLSEPATRKALSASRIMRVADDLSRGSCRQRALRHRVHLRIYTRWYGRRKSSRATSK